jgi:hypothetical protein
MAAQLWPLLERAPVRRRIGANLYGQTGVDPKRSVVSVGFAASDPDRSTPSAAGAPMLTD